MKSDASADLFELQDQNLWLKSEDELNEFWEAKYQDTIDYELFKIAKANTIKICEFAKGVQLDRSLKLPRFPNDDKLLREAVEEGFLGRACPDTKQYWDRIEEEYGLICEKEFASYFLIQKMMVDEARRVGPELLGFGDGSECVGPGRGSICGSLVAYCIGLHDVDPIVHDLKFSRFLSPARGGKQMKIKFTIQPVKRGGVKSCVSHT
jgi:DNA polymerase-3 subunit alpha